MNAKTALEIYGKLAKENAPVSERVAAWDKYLALANAPRAGKTEYATRRSGRSFGVRWNGGENYSDLS